MCGWRTCSTLYRMFHPTPYCRGERAARPVCVVDPRGRSGLSRCVMGRPARSPLHRIHPSLYHILCPMPYCRGEHAARPVRPYSHPTRRHAVKAMGRPTRSPLHRIHPSLYHILRPAPCCRGEHAARPVRPYSHPTRRHAVKAVGDPPSRPYIVCSIQRPVHTGRPSPVYIAAPTGSVRKVRNLRNLGKLFCLSYSQRFVLHTTLARFRTFRRFRSPAWSGAHLHGPCVGLREAKQAADNGPRAWSGELSRESICGKCGICGIWENFFAYPIAKDLFCILL